MREINRRHVFVQQTSTLFFLFVMQVISLSRADTSCNPEELAVCLSDKVAVETRETMLRDSVTAMTERRTALETLLQEKEAALQSLQESYQALETKYAESTSNSEKEMQSLREIHTTQLGLMLEKNTELEASLQTAGTEQQAALDQIHVLQKQVEIFTDHHDEAVQLAALKESCSAAATAHEEAVQSWKDERETLLASHATALDAAATTCASDQDNLIEKHTAALQALRESTEETAAKGCAVQMQQQLESSTAACTTQLSEHNATCQSEIAQAATCHDAVSACQLSCTESTQAAIATEKDMVKRWKGRHERLLESHLRIKETATTTTNALTSTRDELYQLRREVFLAKEQLRKPLLQRQLLWAAMPMLSSEHVQALYTVLLRYWQHVEAERFPMVTKTFVLLADMATETWDQTEDAVREATGWHKPYHQSRGMSTSPSWYEQWIQSPYRQHVLPLYKNHVVPLYSIHIYHDVMVPFYSQQLEPLYRNHVVPFYTDQIQPVYTDTIQPIYTNKIRPVYTDQILPIYVQHAQPLVQQYIHPAVAVIGAFLQRSWQSHQRFMHSTANIVAHCSDVVADYGALEDYRWILQTGLWFRNHALLVVRVLAVVEVVVLLAASGVGRAARPKKVA